jgi:sortase A
LTNRTPDKPNLPEVNALLGRLSIPRLRLATTVREGTGSDTLLLAAGHIRGTALPGSAGNVAVAGHRDTFFRSLEGIRNDDLIVFETLEGRYEYKVESTKIVPPQDISVLQPGRDSELTLVTCYPFEYIGSAPNRFIIKARQVAADRSKELPHEELSQAKIPATPSFAKQALPQQTLPPQTLPQQAVAQQSAISSGTSRFQLEQHRSTQLASGIWMGIDHADADNQQVNGWLWIMPDRRTVWLRDQAVEEPFIFFQHGERRELLIANVTGNSVTGYLVVPRIR